MCVCVCVWEGGFASLRACLPATLHPPPTHTTLNAHTPPNNAPLVPPTPPPTRQFPGKLLAYNCSPSFNWKKKLSDAEIAAFQSTLGALGYKFQFVTLAGFHALNFSMFSLAKDYAKRGMAAYSELQVQEFAAEKDGYAATTHQRFVGTGYFDDLAQRIAEGQASTGALAGSTEEEQF